MKTGVGAAEAARRFAAEQAPPLPPHLRLWGVATAAQLRLYAMELLALVCLEKGGGDLILDTPGAVQVRISCFSFFSHEAVFPVFTCFYLSASWSVIPFHSWCPVS